MKKPHTKARGILFAAAGMFLIPGSVSEERRAAIYTGIGD